MLPEVSRRLRLLLVLLLSVGYVAYHGHVTSAYAKGGGGGDDDGDDDDDGGGGKGGGEEKGGGDDDDDDDGEKDQPAVTAGGLYTIKTYPVRELTRPLTMTQKITQMKVSLGTDLSAKGAFSSGGLSLEAIYGIKDNFSLIGGFTNAYNMKQFAVYGGFEGALAYDMVDFRLAANVHRFAQPRLCGEVSSDPVCVGVDPTLPSGTYTASGVQFSIDLGFPFRYSFTPEIAIVALQTLISIDFNGSQRGTDTDIMNATNAGHPLLCSTPDPMTDGANIAAHAAACVENGAKPDLNPSIGLATNPIPPLSVVIFAQLRIPDFDTSVGNFQIPVTGRVEFSPNKQFDIGLEFTLLNVKPPDPQSPIDNRFLSLFAQARF
jgi:hypothetical protein